MYAYRPIDVTPYDRGVPRPRSLTPQQIGAAALALVDRDGVDALTIRSVAAELGVGAMSLYRYVGGRADIEVLAVEQALAGIGDIGHEGDPDAGEGPWDRRVRTLARRAHDAVRAHPAAAPLLVAHRHRARGTLAWGDAVLAALADAGLDAGARAVAFRGLQALVFGAAQVEAHGPIDGEGTDALATMLETHPHIATTARAAAALGDDEIFDAMCDLWIAGITARHANGRAPTPDRDR